MWNDWKNFVATVLQHVVNALSSEKLERMFGLAKTVEEERQIVMIVKLFDFDFPSDLVALGVVL